MKRLLPFLLAIASAALASGPLLAADPPDAPDQPPAQFKRGAVRTPQHKIAAALTAGQLKVFQAVTTTPAQSAMVPAKMSYWLNNQLGDCVTAEAAANVAEYSTFCGSEYFIEDATVQKFCSKYRICNGADLMSVNQEMQSDGFHQGGDTITSGPASIVDYSNEDTLKNAISLGPVDIAIDANALPGTAGGKNGWYKFGGRPEQYRNTDHCVNLCGYGPTAWCAQQLGVSVPPNAPANCYMLFTWNSIGMVDHDWIMSTVVEAYLRTPSVIINGKPLSPPAPTPTPGPGPTPTPGSLYSLQTNPATGVITLTPAGTAGSVVLTAEQVKAIQAMLGGKMDEEKPAPKPEDKSVPDKAPPDPADKPMKKPEPEARDYPWDRDHSHVWTTPTVADLARKSNAIRDMNPALYASVRKVP